MAVTKVVMPKLSDQMETGKIIKWLKKEGDRVNSGDILAEVETDKADVEMEAFGSGVLRKILVQPGGAAPVGALIAIIAEPSDDVSALAGGVPGVTISKETAPKETVPSVASRPGGAGTGTAERPASIPPPPRSEDQAEHPRPSEAATVTAAPAPTAMPGGPRERVKASPLARKVAAQSGVDLQVVQGSGPGGRIVRKDVEQAVSVAAAVPGARVPMAPALAEPEYEDRRLTQVRAAIARRMPQSKAPVPHFYVTSEIAMDRAWALRDELNALDGHAKISVNDLVIRACALGLLRHPGVNASFGGESIRVYHRAHIGIAVALEDGLITPVLRDCQSKPLAQIAAESRDLAERARQRKLRAPELSGATFSISNLGMFDVESFSAIINPPEGAILAVGSVMHVPVATPEGVSVGRRMRVTLSCDHRVMDGAMGARFLQDVKRLLEEPLRLLV